MRSRLIRMSVVLQHFLAPGLENSQYAYSASLSRMVNQHTDWLDLGCGHQLFPDWMPNWQQHEAAIVNAARSVTGIDVDQCAIRCHRHITRRIVGDLHHLPFKDNSFHLVTANMVVEHVADPTLLLSEVHRVLHPSGLFMLHTPNFLSYATLPVAYLPQSWKNKLAGILQGRREEDVYPTFYRMNTRMTIMRNALLSGLAVDRLQMVESSAQTFMLGPLAGIELLLIRMLRLRIFENYRPNIIAILKKQS